MSKFKSGMNLNIYAKNNDDLQEANMLDVNKIQANMAGVGLYSSDSLLSGKPIELTKINLLQVIIYQNNILIRQNEEISRALGKIYSEVIKV